MASITSAFPRTHRLVHSAIVLILIAIFFSTPFSVTDVQAAGSSCLTSGPASGAYTVTPCVTGPADGMTITGDQSVAATYSTTGANPGVAKLIFYLGGNYLITDYQAPYTFTLPSTKFVDGTYALEVEALMKDGFTSQRASISVVLHNGITRPPVNTNTFTPTTGTTPPAGQPFVLVTAGDGADGATNAGNVTNLINSWNPNLFLYVGDVYEKGTSTEFYNWYGAGSTFYGRFRPVTDPVIGNHEYENGVAPGYFDYWNNVPNYYSYNANGWHFIALNSNCSLLNNCQPGQAQYNWLLNDLNTHNNQCTIAYFHHPVYNVGPEGYASTMNAMWSLMAQHGVDIVLTGHDHDYQRWVPLNGNGQPSSMGMTEFVAGTGGHGIQQFITTDSRMAVGYDASPYAFGALRFQLNQDGASFQYINYQGLVLDSGAIPCSGAPADVTAPSSPSNLTATGFGSTQANLAWTASTDNVGVVGYDLYRNNAFLTSVGLVTSYTDNNLTPGTTYTYQVRAHDGAGNTSAFSNSASVTMQSLMFSDGFESGNLSAWTSSANLTVQQTPYEGAYAVRATSTGAAQASASKTLGGTQSNLYYNLRFKVLSLGTTSAYLQRFRTGSNASLLGVFINGSTGKLGVRNDISATSLTNGPTVTQNAWHQLQTHVIVNGTSSTVEVWYDGTQVAALSSSTQSLGTTPIGRIQLGDATATNVYDIVLDNVGVNTSYVDDSDAQAPSTPGSLAASPAAPNAVSLTWNASSDNVGVTGYDVFRNGSLAASVGIVTSYTDTPVAPDFAYQYQIRARDGAGNVSAFSNTATVTTPADTAAPSVALTAPDDGLTVNGIVRIAADATDDVGVDHVDFMLNGSLAASVGEGGPYEFLWDTTTVPDGTVIALTAQALDGSSNTTTSASRTITVNNGGGDTLPPSVPGNFTAVAGGASRVDLAWAASTDNFGVTGYDVYRNGALLTGLGAVTTYSDSSVVQGTTYQYQVLARDAAGNVSALTAPLPVTLPAPLFSDGFESGNLSLWTNNGLSAQQQIVLDGAYAARGTANGSAATYAYKQLLAAQSDLYYSSWFRIMSQGATSAYLQRFRTSTNGALLGVFVSSTGKLGYRNDVTSSTVTSTTGVSQNTWHQLQTHVNINGAISLVEVWLDGVQVTALSKAESLGSTPVGRVQLADSQTGDVYDAAFDNVAFDTSYIQPQSAVNTTIDSGPVGAVNSNAASFSFSSSSGGATFECGLDGAAYAACTSPQGLSGLADGAHTFAVRALDTLGNVDPTPATRTWSIDTTAPAVTGTSPTDTTAGVPIAVQITASFSEAMAPASLTGSTFTLALQTGGTPVAATVTYNAASNTAALQPSAPLAYASAYVVTVKGGIGGAADLAGNPLASDVAWSFTTVGQDVIAPTVSVTQPVEGATVGGIVALAAEAADDVAVARVDFLMNGTIVGTDASAPYSVSWDASAQPNGPAVIIAQAVDTAGNVGTSVVVNVAISNDVTPPSVPLDLTASAPSGSRVDLAWSASTDSVGVTGYDIFRNGSPLQSVGAATNYSDTTVGPSNTYQYQVRARDAAGNVSGLSAPASATTSDVLFRDRLETGDLSRWSAVSGLVVGQQEVFAGNYAAGATTNGPVANAQQQFGTGQYDLYYDLRVKVISQDPTSSVYVQRFRKADTLSAVGVFISPTGKLGYRNDIAGIANTSSASVSPGAWHEIQTHVKIDPNGGSGLVEVWLDGALVQSQAEALGNSPVSRIQLGDSNTGRTYDFAYDDAQAAPFYINPGDTQPPGAPGNLNAVASAANQVDLTWGAASDDVGVAGYNVYRNGSIVAFLGNVTSFSDTTALPSTTFQYTVSARDAAENISAPSAPASATTQADSTPPTVSMTAPSNGAKLSGTVALSATASDNIGVARVDFLVNGSVVGTDATTPYSFSWNSGTVADGLVSLAAQAIDVANNPATSSINATVDNTPPNTTITSGPAALVNSTSASFSFTSNEAGASFACSLDGAFFSACTSPKAYTGLSSAAHTFAVQATDGAGNVDATPASWSWSVDAVAPAVTSTIPADRATNVSPAISVVAAFSEAMNPATISTSTFILKPKGGNSSLVAATVTYDAATNMATLRPNANLATQTTYNASLNGAKDLAGNSVGNTTWSFTTGILDTTAPTVSLTAPSNGAFVHGTVTLAATASDNVAVSSVSFLVNGAAVGTDTTSPYSISWNSTAVADGPVTIAARAVDPSNNSTTTANITVTVDNTPPDTSITSGPSGTVTSTSASFGFTSSEASSTFGCSLDGGAFSSCTSPASYSNLAGGSHTFQARAIDRAGNVDLTPASQSWTVNPVTAPDTSITSGPSGSVKSTSASFSFTSTQTGSTFECSLDASSFSACTSPTSYSNLPNGSHTFQVRAISSGGIVDSTPASRTWTVDTVGPTGVAIISPANGATVSGQVTISASAGDNVGVASVSFYVDGQLLASDSAAPYTTTWNANKARAGSHTLYVIATDAAGNTTQSTTITVTR